MPNVYGLIISFSLFICVFLVNHRTKQNPHVWDVFLVAVVCGLVGARIYHVIDFWNVYAADPVLFFYFWNGGLGIWGAIIGSVVGLLSYLRFTKQPALYWLDTFASVAPLAQAIGRFGNYFNQENFGYPTNLPWGVFIDQKNRPAEFMNSSFFHPLFLYESVLNLFLFFVLSRFWKKYGTGSGKIFWFYLMGYSVIRFFLEFLKPNPWEINGFPVAQLFSVTVFIISTAHVTLNNNDIHRI